MHLERHRRICLAHGSDVHILDESNNRCTVAEFIGIYLHLGAVRLEILREQNRAELAFIEIPSFEEFQPQHLRQIPAAVDHAHRHLAVTEIRTFRHISIRAADEIIRVGYVLHFRKRTQLFPQPVGLRAAVLAADIHYRQVILVVAAWILLHELALTLDEQHEDEQRRRNNELHAHQNGPEVLA